MNHRKRDQKPKFIPTENTALYEAMLELRRSNAAVPIRNKTKYNRNDERRIMQSGRYDD